MVDESIFASQGVAQIDHIVGVQQLLFDRRITELIVRRYAEVIVRMHTQIAVHSRRILQLDLIPVHVRVDQGGCNQHSHQPNAAIPIGGVLFVAEITIQQSERVKSIVRQMISGR